MTVITAVARALVAALLVAAPARAAPTRSSPIGVAADGQVFVVNPDQSTVAQLEYDAMSLGAVTHEAPVGAYPRTLALAGGFVFTADQTGDGVSRRSQVDLGDLRQAALGPG
jgi:hypothetical protein